MSSILKFISYVISGCRVVISAFAFALELEDSRIRSLDVVRQVIIAVKNVAADVVSFFAAADSSSFPSYNVYIYVPHVAREEPGRHQVDYAGGYPGITHADAHQDGARISWQGIAMYF